MSSDGLQRYEVRPDVDGNTYGHEEPSGEWVKYSDVLAMLKSSSDGMDAEQAKEALTGGDLSLDAAADSILMRVAKFFGECVQSEEFCALGIDEKRDATGKLQYLRLVPCDLVGNEPARRWPKE